MKPLVQHGKYMTELNTSPVYDDTMITLRVIRAHVMVYQNDQIIALVSAPVMKVVRGIRSMFNNAKMQLI